MVWIIYRLRFEKYKNEGENRNEKGRKGGSFSRWNIFFENNKHTACFYLIFTQKNEFRFSKQSEHKLKYLELFKVLWTNS